jgi:hypothetical protein
MHKWFAGSLPFVLSIVMLAVLAPRAYAQNAQTGRPLFGTTTSLQPNINAPSRQAEFAVRFQF